MSSLQSRVKGMSHDNLESATEVSFLQPKVNSNLEFRKPTRNRSMDECSKIRRKCHSTRLLLIPKSSDKKLKQYINLAMADKMNVEDMDMHVISKRPVTPEKQKHVVNDVARKIFYYNIQERLNSVNKILDQYEVSSSSEDENTQFEPNEKNNTDIAVVTAPPVNRISLHHPYYQSVQNTVASFIVDETESTDGNVSSIQSHIANNKNSSQCQNAYYQSVQCLGSGYKLQLPVQTIIFGYPASMCSKGYPRDDITTLTASETATVLSLGTDIQTVNMAHHVAEVSDDDTDEGSDTEEIEPSSSICPDEDNNNVFKMEGTPETPTLSIASDRAVMGKLYDSRKVYEADCFDFPRKISFQNSAEIGYTSLKDLVKSEQYAKKNTMVDNRLVYIHENVGETNQHISDEEPATPATIKSKTLMSNEIDLLGTTDIFVHKLTSPFKALNDEGNEISRVRDTDKCDDSYCSVNSTEYTSLNGIGSSIVPSLDLFQKNRRTSQECACTIM